MNFDFSFKPDSGFHPGKTEPLPKKTLHQLGNRFGCSILGTCLEIKELLKISRKVGVTVPVNATEYDIHSKFVMLVHSNSSVAAYIQKYLNKKYRKQVNRCKPLATPEALLDFWDSAMADGNVAGAYWTVLTHPFATDNVVEQVFGEVHMMGHQVGASNRVDMRRLVDLEKKCKILDQTLDETKTKYKQEISRQNSRIKELEHQLETRNTEVSRLKETEEQLKSFQQSLDSETLLAEKKEFQEKYSNEKKRADEADQKVLETIKRVSVLQRIREKLVAKQDQLNDQLESQELFITDLLEKRICNGESCRCNRECPCPGVVGKKLLYIGGRTNLIQYYRTLVEENGGSFLHHDGGNEDSLSRLGELLKNVDAVFCPVDCVSHGACLKAKDACKRRGKPFVLLRSSGLSAFAGGVCRFFSSGGSDVGYYAEG